MKQISYTGTGNKETTHKRQSMKEDQAMNSSSTSGPPPSPLPSIIITKANRKGGGGRHTNNNNNNINITNNSTTSSKPLRNKKKKKSGSSAPHQQFNPNSIQLPLLKVTVRCVGLHHVHNNTRLLESSNKAEVVVVKKEELEMNNKNDNDRSISCSSKEGEEEHNNHINNIEVQMKALLKELCSSVSHVIFQLDQEQDDGYDDNHDHSSSKEREKMMMMSRNSGVVIHARVLYMVLPKMSKRRGEIPGYAQLVLTPNREQLIRNVAEATHTSATSPISSIDNAVEANDSKEDEDKDTLTPVAVSKNKTLVHDNVTVTHMMKSQIIANAKLGLLSTLEALINQGKNMALAVELSRSQRTYKNTIGVASKENAGKGGKNRRDKLIGSWERSEAFKTFMASQEKSEEERNVRKKPTPGGGIEPEDDEKVAAIVQYLREQRGKEKEKQEAKKKAKELEKEEMKRMKKLAKKEHKKFLRKQKRATITSAAAQPTTTSAGTTVFTANATEFVPGAMYNPSNSVSATYSTPNVGETNTAPGYSNAASMAYYEHLQTSKAESRVEKADKGEKKKLKRIKREKRRAKRDRRKEKKALEGGEGSISVSVQRSAPEGPFG